MHPIMLGILSIVFVLGIATGLLIHVGRDYESQSVLEEPFVQSASQASEADGRVFGFVDTLSGSSEKIYLRFDRALWLTGEAATDAAISAGVCTPERSKACLPGGYYIENNSVELSLYVVSTGVRIIVGTLERGASIAYESRQSISLSEFRQLFEDPRSATTWRSVPFWITLKDGAVVSIEEQYVP